jgi:hypothetical protein
MAQDLRLRLLSHSSRQLLHECPRKYQLYRLTPPLREFDVHTDFGSTLGVGIQEFLTSGSKQQAIWKMFCEFQGDLYDDGEKAKKTFLHAVFAIDLFSQIRDTLLLDYEVATFHGKPAIELGFRVSVGDAGFLYRGFVDVVLVSRSTGKLLVLELKTTGMTAQEAVYANSGQGLGYSIFTKEIAPAVEEFDVLYLVFETKAAQFVPLRFTKHHTERALWIQDLIADCQIINVYENFEVWPRHGESCFSFFKPCHWFGMCHMSNRALIQPGEQEVNPDKPEEVYDFELHLADLMQTQREAVEAS